MQQSTALDPAQIDAVRALAAAATAADGVAPLSEETLLSLDRQPGPDGETATYLSVRDGEDLAAYAQVARDGSAEIVVHPEHRRRGYGRRLLDGVIGVRPDARVWAHGNVEGAQALAASAGLQVVRELWKMTLDAEAHPTPEPVVPQGFSARAFVPGQDEQAWLDVNARAFAYHPEQGRMTLEDLQDRMQQSWFDPAGLILVEDTKGGALAASHWTKVEAPEGAPGLDTPSASAPGYSAGGASAPSGSTSASGEVYVVAVDPAYQGHGLGKVVTALGLRHLQERGIHHIDLYVEGDNAPAVATYSRLGFERSALDVMYSRGVHEGLSR
ncbi:mycothiol synthase [Luteipulveratus halotolerans]|nr:mycothiol synthase [Luteipulveratus halotolerans]